MTGGGVIVPKYEILDNTCLIVETGFLVYA